MQVCKLVHGVSVGVIIIIDMVMPLLTVTIFVPERGAKLVAERRQIKFSKLVSHAHVV